MSCYEHKNEFIWKSMIKGFVLDLLRHTECKIIDNADRKWYDNAVKSPNLRSKSLWYLPFHFTVVSKWSLSSEHYPPSPIVNILVEQLCLKYSQWALCFFTQSKTWWMSGFLCRWKNKTTSFRCTSNYFTCFPILLLYCSCSFIRSNK